MTDPALGYTRLSQEGKSIPEQKQQIRDYCDRLGLDLVEIYNDGQQASGYSEDRPEYQQMLDRLDEADHVVVRGLSRLSRDRLHRVKLLIDLHERGVDVHSVERGEAVDLSDPYALTRESAQADADDHEKRKEAQRGEAEYQRRVEEGLDVGRPPTGMQFDDAGERWVADPDEIEACLEAIRLREEEELTYEAIADRTGLNRETIRRTIVPKAERYREVAREAGLIPQRQ